MRKEDFFEALGNIDERYIVEAEAYKKAKVSSNVIFRYVGIAASVILVAGIIGIIMFLGSAHNTSPGKSEQTYATSTAYYVPDAEESAQSEETTIGPEDTTTTSTSDSQPWFYETRFYVMVGRCGKNRDKISLRYFDGDDVKTVEWDHDPDDFEYGDVFIPDDGTIPREVTVDKGKKSERTVYVLDEDAVLEKAGNVKDLMELRPLTVTSSSEDDQGNVILSIKDDDGFEYEYIADPSFEVDLGATSSGQRYIFAVNNYRLILPVEEE